MRSPAHANGGPSQALDPHPLHSHNSVHEPTLLDYWRVLVKRRAVVIGTFAVIFTLVVIATFRATKMYQALARVAVFRETPEVLDFKDGAPVDTEDWDYTVAIETQVRVMQSDSLSLQVAKDVGFDKQFALPPAGRGGPAVEYQLTPAQEAQLIGMVRGNLQIASIPNTRMIELRYTNSDPQMAANVLNTFMQEYIQDNIRSKYDSTVQATQWLSKQLADLRLKVETSQAKLVDYEKRNDILGLDEKQNIITAKLNDLNKELTDATSDRIQRQATFGLTRTNSPELLSHADPNSLIEQLRTREADLKTQYAMATTQFGPSYPKVAELANEIQQVQISIQQETKRIAGRLQGQYDAAQQRESLLQAALNKQKADYNLLNERAIQYSLLKRDLDTNQQLYDSLLQRMKEASVSAALKSSNIRIVDVARVPMAPAEPNVPRNLGLGFLAALTLAVIGGFTTEMLDNTVRTPEQVQVISALPALGVIPLSVSPHRKALPGNGHAQLHRTRVEVISHAYPKSEIAEAYRALRTSILLSSMGAPPQVILVTSALPQEGKTTTAVNAAIVLAQQGGRVLLADADMRRPNVHQSLGMSGLTMGLSSLLAGQGKPEDAIMRSPQLPNLHVLPAGPTPPQPSELLSSSVMKQWLDAWRQQFDHVVLDSPPALSVTDAVALSVFADSVLLVVRSGSTNREALRRARDLLLRVNARLSGVVINAVDLRSPDLHHYYYSGYAGGYGYAYYDDSTTEKRR